MISYCPLKISFAGEGSDASPFIEQFGGSSISATLDLGVSVRYRNDDLPLEVFLRNLGSSSASGKDYDSNNFTWKVRNLAVSCGLENGRIIIGSDLPFGSGFGVSSALSAAILELANFIQHRSLDEMDLAAGTLKVQGEFLGALNGKSAPYAVTVGGAKLILFEENGSVQVIRDVRREILDQVSRRIILAHPKGTDSSHNHAIEKPVKPGDVEMRTGYLVGQQRDLAETMWGYLRDGNLEGFFEGISRSGEITQTLPGNSMSTGVRKIISTAFKNGAVAAKPLGLHHNGSVLVIAGENNRDSLVKLISRISKYAVRAGFDYSGTRVY